jgi:hypothetical protein
MDINGVNNDRYNRANNYVLKIMQNTTDVRYQYFFDKAQTPLGTNLYWGYDYGYVDPNPNNPKSVNSSGVGGPGLARAFTQDQWLLTSVESLFMQTEAKQRGYLAGDPKAAYIEAVRESFRWLGVPNPDATADAYMAAQVASAYANYDAATNKIKLIITQKYLSLVGIANFEAWADYRRTGFPEAVGSGFNGGSFRSQALNVGPNIPLRYRYPLNEYNYNPINVNAEGTLNPFTQGVFWDL